MNRLLRSILLSGFAAAILIACRTRPTPTPTPSEADPDAATIREVINAVQVRVSGGDLAPAQVGDALGAGGHIETGNASKARLDFPQNVIVRLAPHSAFTLIEIENAGADPIIRLKLESGAIWVNVPRGQLEAETLVGVATVEGSFAIIRYDPGQSSGPDDDLLVLDCLEGTCSARNDESKAQMGNLERTVLNEAGLLRMFLNGADVQAFLQDNPEAADLVQTLTAAPPATQTPRPTDTEQPEDTATSAPTGTFTRMPTATPIILPSPSVTASPTRTATSAPLLGVHVVRQDETLLCVARAYGVAPEAIAQENGLRDPFTLIVGQRLRIPAARWTAVIPGPLCAAQFASPFAPPTPTPPTASRTPTLTPTRTPSPVPTCTLGYFFNPGLGRCEPLNTPGPGNTATNTPLPTATNTPGPTNTPTETSTPLPDTLGPAITNPSTNPINVVGDGASQCPVTFHVTLADPSGVASGTMIWTAYDSTPTQIGNGNQAMALISGDAFLGDWEVVFNVPVPMGGHLEWSVLAYDTLSNFQTISTSPTWDVNNLGTGDCLP